MILNKPLFDKLVEEAWNQDFSGWDFGYISKRMIESDLSWDYRQRVLDKIKGVTSLLDQDTGGGEFLSGLQPLPPITYATEGYTPNLPVARARLEKLGVQVVDTSATARLPFSDNFFDLVINRHGGFLASEVYRILKPGRIFVTQQVGGRNCIKLNEILQDQVDFPDSYWTLDYAIRELQQSNLRILDQKEEYPPVEFRDIGAVVFYLKAISWQVSDFSVEKYYERLVNIHNSIQETGKFVITEHRFYIEAQKQ